MADNTTGLPVQTISGQFVATKLVDSGGTNTAAVDASGRLSTNLGSIGGSVPSATNPLFVELSTGAAAYTLFGQAIGSAPWTRITDGTTTAGVIAGSTALKTDISSIAGTVPGATSFVPARLTDGSAYYTRTGQAVGTAAYGIITDGTLQATVRDTGTNDSLNVSIVDASGNQIVSFGGGTQFAGDAAAGYAATGTMMIAVAKAAAPADMSADGDAVEAWALRNGSLVVNLASGGTLVTIGQKTAANGLPVTLASDQAVATAPLHVVLGTGAADYTLFGQAAATAPFTRITDATNSVAVIATILSLKTDLSSIAGVVPGATSYVPSRLTDGSAYYTRTGQSAGTGVFSAINDGTTTAGVIAATTALKTDISSVAGTAAVTGGINGVQAIGGPVAADGVISTNNPLIMGTRVSAAAPADMSADNDVGYLWALRNGSLVVNMASGGTLLTNIGQAAATSKFVRINDGTTTAGVIAGTTALKTDLSSYLGSVVAVANPIAVRLSDGAAFYAAGSGAPTDPKYGTQTSSALGAGASVRLNHYVTSGKTGQLIGIDAGSTVPCKVEIQTIVTGTPTTRVVLFTKPYEVYQWRAPYKTFITRASADATSGFSVTVTNKDAAIAADVYSTGYWDEV